MKLHDISWDFNEYGTSGALRESLKYKQNRGTSFVRPSALPISPITYLKWEMNK